ncbi:dual specificity protein phosphatase 19 [Fopius arisanus]|uniref:Dual specificity protein phosphatase 19 n=1 Tax=Fopius arisanus TaxID=64838 RepID=A0A9R1TVA7_9HYME|nr:PREDICTED: dual specificity protein phosphatase 19 [Fopius arisanus]
MEKLGEGFAFVVDEKPDLQVAEVAPGVFLSSQDPVFSLEILKNLEIRNILSLGIEPHVKFEGISYSFVDMLDVPEFGILEAMDNCLEVIRNRRGNILVHCNAGVSRSATVAIAYLMEEGMSFPEAFNKVRSVRPCARPNEGFIKQLKDMEKKKTEEKY